MSCVPLQYGLTSISTERTVTNLSTALGLYSQLRSRKREKLVHNKCLAQDFLWKQFKGPYRICFEVSKFLFVQFFVFWLVLSFGYQPLFAKGARAVEIESSSFVIFFVFQQRAILSSILTVRDSLYHQLMCLVDRCISYLHPTM